MRGRVYYSSHIFRLMRRNIRVIGYSYTRACKSTSREFDQCDTLTRPKRSQHRFAIMVDLIDANCLLIMLPVFANQATGFGRKHERRSDFSYRVSQHKSASPNAPEPSFLFVRSDIDPHLFQISGYLFSTVRHTLL